VKLIQEGEKKGKVRGTMEEGERVVKEGCERKGRRLVPSLTKS